MTSCVVDPQKQAAAIEKEKVAWVFGLTGGELSDNPWCPVLDCEDKKPFVCSYWYEGVPEYVHEDYPDWHDGSYRTIVIPGEHGFANISGPPPTLEDGDGIWEFKASFRSSGEVPCPLKDAEEPVATSYYKCRICGGVLSEHCLVDHLGRDHLDPDPHILDEEIARDHYTFDHRIEECPFCEEKLTPGEEKHTVIYLGEGGYEAIYRLKSEEKEE